MFSYKMTCRIKEGSRKRSSFVPGLQVATAKEKEAERERLRAERRAQKEAEAAEKQVIPARHTVSPKVPRSDQIWPRRRLPDWHHDRDTPDQRV